VGYAGEQAPPAGQDRDPESFRISVDVALVVLHATVTDRQGGFVSDLGEQDFEVYENGVPQRIQLFKTKIFRSPWDWLSTTAPPCGRNLRR
jgi:hypothetical protein